MKERTRNSLATAVTSALTLIGATAGAADPQPPTLVVRVFDHAHVGNRGLARAEAQAQQIFAAAGVRLVWADGKTGGGQASMIQVTLVSPEELAAQGRREVVLGWADRTDLLAFASPQRVNELAAKKNMDERVLLGRVMAHEIGHLVLPGFGHSLTGIMTAGIYTNPQGVEARFTERETQAMRALLESKAESADEEAGSEK